MQTGLKFKVRRRVYLFLRLAALALMLAAVVKSLLTGAGTGDFMFFALVALVWFTLTILMDFGMRRLEWRDRWYDKLLVCMDVYFLVLCLSLLSLTAGWAVRVLAFYGFVVAIISTPGASLLAGLAGLAAYFTGYQMGGGTWPVFRLALLVVAAGVICGTAWRLCLPLIIKAIYRYLLGEAPVPAPSPVSATEEPGGDSSASAPEAAAEAAPAPPEADKAPDLSGQLAERAAELEALRKEKESLQAELDKTNEELLNMFNGGGGGDQSAEELRRQLAEKDAQLETLSKEKDSLAAELEKTNEELTNLFKV